MANPESYTWNQYHCTYEYQAGQGDLPLLLIHPLGVGLSRWFWHRFCREFRRQGFRNAIYNPDLLGCGDSDKPAVAYTPDDWAAQLEYFIRTIIQRPVGLVIQGAGFPIGLKLVERTQPEGWVRSLVLGGPPGWSLITTGTSHRSQKLLWNMLFSGPVGAAFFRYARREAFLKSFSRRQLFDNEQAIDREWLDHLEQDAANAAGRYAVFSFLAGFWREDYSQAIETIQQPTLVLFGQEASGIDRISRADDAQKRLQDYLQHIPNSSGKLISGRNVLPYEATEEFVRATGQWLEGVRGQ
jgi:pimeloyl-ACP methyl ester carboxylesterase